MSYGYLSQLATAYFGPAWAWGGELKQQQDACRVTLNVWVENDRGQKVAVGDAVGFLRTA